MTRTATRTETYPTFAEAEAFADGISYSDWPEFVVTDIVTTDNGVDVNFTPLYEADSDDAPTLPYSYGWGDEYEDELDSVLPAPAVLAGR